MEDAFGDLSGVVGTILCVGIPLALLVLFLRDSDRRNKLKQERIEQAKKKYQTDLNLLRKTPTDASQRQKTLMSGREYARLLREDKKETIFDEIALMNDLNAIAGGQVETEAKPRVEVKEEKSIEERLRILEDLKSKELLSEEEYQQRKSDILGQI